MRSMRIICIVVSVLCFCTCFVLAILSAVHSHFVVAGIQLALSALFVPCWRHWEIIRFKENKK